MKKALFVIFVLVSVMLVPVFGFCQAPTLVTWDAPPDQDLAGFRVYFSETSGSYTFGPTSPNLKATVLVPEGQAIVELPTDGKTWYVVATAYDVGGNEGPPSNEDSITMPDTAPGAPSNLKIILQLTKLPDGSYSVAFIKVEATE